jgi:hypothetical protein
MGIVPPALSPGLPRRQSGGRLVPRRTPHRSGRRTPRLSPPGSHQSWHGSAAPTEPAYPGARGPPRGPTVPATWRRTAGAASSSRAGSRLGCSVGPAWRRPYLASRGVGLEREQRDNQQGRKENCEKDRRPLVVHHWCPPDRLTTLTILADSRAARCDSAAGR